VKFLPNFAVLRAVLGTFYDYLPKWQIAVDAYSAWVYELVAGGGFEPPTFGL